MARFFSEINSPRIDAVLKTSCYWMLFLILNIMVASQSGASLSPNVHKFVYALSIPAIALMIVWIMVKWERKSLADYELVWRRDTFLKFLKGLAIGALSYLGIVLILVVFAGLEIDKNPNGWTLWTLIWYLPIIPLALMEEIAFRSYPFLKLNKAFGLRITQPIVAIVFALYHIIFLGWPVLTAFLGPGIWALVFGVIAIRSKGIAQPTGIHVGLNLTLTLLGMSMYKCESIWVVNGDLNVVVGLITRLLVLITGVILTELYIRKSKKELAKERT